MTADEIRSALRDRHPATIRYGPNLVAPGPWTTLEEWLNIDFIAFSAWSKPPSGGVNVKNPIVGYEIKISRSDYRRELRNPGKRATAVGFTNAFYFAVPDGLLKPAELVFEPVDWLLDHKAWARTPCPVSYEGGEAPGHAAELGPCYRGKRYSRESRGEVKCERCGGRGHVGRSRVEQEAPTLWVPDDVGLVVVPETGPAKVAKRAPIRPSAPGRSPLLGVLGGHDAALGRRALAELVRWTSVRPDPRHAAVGRDGPMP